MSGSCKDNAIEVIYLEDSVKEYAEGFLSGDKKKEADLTNPTINWDHMIVTHGKTRYTKSGDYARPKTHVLFTANFVNDTPSPQTYALRTDRRTTSSSMMSFKKSFMHGGDIRLSLSPPSSAIGASVGFKKQVSEDRGVTRSTEQELSWSVDNQITVPSGYQTKAKLLIKEDNYSGDFTIRCTFEGRVLVSYYHKQTKTHLKTVSAPVKECFDPVREFVKDNLNRPVFIVRGYCQFRFGIEQNVTLKQTKITPKNEAEEVQSDSQDELSINDDNTEET